MEFLTRVKSMGRLLNLDNNALLTRFLGGLQNSIRNKLILHQPQTLDAAASFAQEIYRQSQTDPSNTFLEAANVQPSDLFTAIMTKLDSLSLKDNTTTISTPSPPSPRSSRPPKAVRFR